MKNDILIGVGVLALLAVSQQAIAEVQTAPAVIRVEEQTVLSAQLAGQIVDMPFKTGQSFARGDILVSFDCTRYEADLAEAEASHAAAQARHDINTRLHNYKALGAGELRVSAAEMAGASARVDAINATLRNCHITAPYDGRVVATEASLYASAEPGAPVMEILKDNALVVELIVPSLWLRWLGEGQSFDLDVRETGQTLRARIDRLGAMVDPVSQTIDVYAVFEDAPDQVLPGMSGAAHLTGPTNVGVTQ